MAVADPSTPILIVNNHREMLRLIRSLLQRLGFHNVDETNDAAAVLPKLQGASYGAVISDWDVEPINGLALLREIRAKPGLESLRFIMISAAPTADSVAAAREAGVAGYIVKPFSAATFKKALVAALGEF